MGCIIGQLRVHHVDGRQHALLANGHGFVVEAGYVDATLAQVVAHLHKIRLHGWNVVKFFKLDTIVDNRRLQKWIRF